MPERSEREGGHSEDQELAGRAALITGGAGAIGTAIARSLAAAGANIAIQDLRADAADQAVQAVRGYGVDSVACVGDVSSPEDIDSMFAAVQMRWGRIDILVNNAGFQHVAPIEDYRLEIWRQMLDVHLTAAFLTTRAAIPSMKARRWGRLIYMSSINGKIGNAYKSAYCAAKHGLIGLAKTAALELAGHGITSNAVCPGYAGTPMVRNQLADLARHHGYGSDEEALERVLYPDVPQRRLIQPDEVAGLVAYLCLDRARGITGQAINVSGGFVMH